MEKEGSKKRPRDNVKVPENPYATRTKAITADMTGVLRDSGLNEVLRSVAEAIQSNAATNQAQNKILEQLCSFIELKLASPSDQTSTQKQMLEQIQMLNNQVRALRSCFLRQTKLREELHEALDNEIARQEELRASRDMVEMEQPE